MVSEGPPVGKYGTTESWQRDPRTDPTHRHTFYAVLQVEGSARGIAYEFEEIDADAPDQYATLALQGTTKDGRLRPITYAEFKRDFDKLLEDAVNRSGVFPKGQSARDSVNAIFRHKDN